MSAVVPGVEVEDVTVHYDSGVAAVTPLESFSMRAAPGQLVILLGPSGCGKSTMLSVIGGMRSVSSGAVRVAGIDVTTLSGPLMDAFRQEQVGYVFRRSNLIPSLSAAENVAVPLLVHGVSRGEALGKARDALDLVGLSTVEDLNPSALSSGQKRRVSVARAIVADPPLLLADEPTARLDHIAAQEMIMLLRTLATGGRTVLVATHDVRFRNTADRTIPMVPDLSTSTDPPTEVTLQPGQTLYAQGSRGDRIFVLSSGEVEVLRQQADGGEELLDVVSAPGHVGEVGPHLGFPRATTVRARTAVAATSYSQTDFQAFQRAQQQSSPADEEPTIVAPASDELPTLVTEPPPAADLVTPDVPPPPP